MSATQTYTALTPIEHDGKPYAEGEPIKLTDEQAQQLLGLRAIEPRGAKRRATEPEVASDKSESTEGQADKEPQP